MGSTEIGRSGQGFPSIASWGTAYGTDCASSIWAYPVPDGVTAGDLAQEDEGLDCFPWACAYVKDNNNQAESEISLKVYDYAGNERINDDFNGGGDPSENLCQHPSVEVTYSRAENDSTGILRIHVVWSEWVTYHLTDNFDIYYRYIEYPVNANGVQWNSPNDDDTVRLTFSDYQWDDIQPDISVLPTLNDVFLTYLVNKSGRADDIVFNRHERADMDDPGEWWSGNSCTISSTSNDKWGPRCGAGRFSYGGGTYTPPGGVIFVWSELQENEDYDDWQLYSNEYNMAMGLQGVSRFSVGTGNTINYNPQVDLLPQSCSEFGEAVIVWDSAVWDDEEEEFTDYQVVVAVTPYHAVPIYQRDLDYDGMSRAADVSCYQRIDDMQSEKEWFAVSYQGYDSVNSKWVVRAFSYTFDIDYDEDEVGFYEQTDIPIQNSEGQWSFDYPASAPSIALCDVRDKDYVEDIKFLLMFIDSDGGSDFDAKYTVGTIDQ